MSIVVSIPSYAPSTSSSPISTFGPFANPKFANKYPPGLGLGAWRTPSLHAAITSASLTKRNPVRATRAAPPPPPPAVLYDSAPTHQHRRNSVSFSNASPIPLETLQRERAAADREARARVVAGILLNRVHAVGRPMRRRRNLSADGSEGRGYVRSGLSRMVSVGDC